MIREPAALTLSLHQTSVPLFRQGLTALATILDKTVAQCAERKIDPAVLLADRLPPDMFPLTRQVQPRSTGRRGARSRSTSAARACPSRASPTCSVSPCPTSSSI